MQGKYPVHCSIFPAPSTIHIFGKGEVGEGGQAQASLGVVARGAVLTMVMSRRGGGLCLILGDPRYEEDFISLPCRVGGHQNYVPHFTLCRAEVPPKSS